MKRLAILCSMIPFVVFGQVNGHDEPGFLKEIELQESQAVMLDAPNTEKLLALQLSAKANKTLVPMGVIVPVYINEHQFSEIPVDEGFKGIAYNLSCKGAKGLTVYLRNVSLPIGSKLYVSNRSGSQIYGPYTYDDVLNDKLTPAMIDGDFIRVTLVYKTSASLHPKVEISELGYNVGDLTRPKNSFGSRDFDDSENCQVNANCSEGDNWRNQQKAVVRIKLRIQNYEGWCTGTIMNNTLQDCTPYILTADHCREVEGIEALPENYDDWQFYLNYEGEKCSNPRNEGQVSKAELTGCKKIMNTKRKGSGGADHMLLKLANKIDGSLYEHYYAGWQNFSAASPSGVMIHHPSGDIKKISTYTTAIIESEWDAKFGEDTHWQVYWSKTDNGFGVSEPGSSGSALWNNKGQVIGVLTGGASACKEDKDKGVSPDYPDYFGKFSLAFGYKGSDPEVTLFDYLDGSNLTPTLDGISWPCSEEPLTKEQVIEQTSELISLYPNPTSENLSIDFNGLAISRVSIFDFRGVQLFHQEVHSNPNLNLNTQDWNTGMYLVQLQTENNLLISKKLIVE